MFIITPTGYIIKYNGETITIWPNDYECKKFVLCIGNLKVAIYKDINQAILEVQSILDFFYEPYYMFKIDEEGNDDKNQNY